LNDALVVCSHLPDEGHFESVVYPTVSVPCVGVFDYWAGLDRLWACGRSLVMVEHDLEVTDEHIRSLTDCLYGLCTVAYQVHWRTTGHPTSIFAHHQLGKAISRGNEWADWSGIGLCKVGRDVRVGELRREPWPRVELALNDAVRGPWHVHWPEATHHHY
jgi:hypothetical protein